MRKILRRRFKVNALGARNLAIVAAKMQAKMVQLSTDDVFDGKSTEPYTEFDITNPGTVYGKSKLAGENYVKDSQQNILSCGAPGCMERDRILSMVS